MISKNSVGHAISPRIISGSMTSTLLLFDRLLSRVANRVNKLRNKHIISRLRSVGKNVCLSGRIQISNPENVVLGSNVHLHDGTYIMSQGGVVIEDNTHVGRNLRIITRNHNHEGDLLPYDQTFVHKCVKVGRNVWIGDNVMIIPGVEIGDGAIIGMGTVVSKDIPPLAIVGSQPPRIIKYRDRIHYEELDQDQRYGGRDGLPINSYIDKVQE